MFAKLVNVPILYGSTISKIIVYYSSRIYYQFIWFFTIKF